MPTVTQIYADLVGSQNVTWSGFPIGSTVQYNFTCYDPADQSEVLDLTGLAVIFTMKAIGTDGLPTGDAIISRECDIVIAADGTCYAPISSGDTVPSGDPITAGYYAVDVWAEDEDGDRLDLGYGLMQMSAAVRLPDDEVVPLPAQEPLAQGPTGPSGTAATDRVADSAIPQYALVKASSTAGRVTLFLTTDTAQMVTGVAMEAAAAQGDTISVQEVQGVMTPMLSDGTATITAGQLVTPSTTVNGRVKQGSANPVGSAFSNAAATLDAQVNVL